MKIEKLNKAHEMLNQFSLTVETKQDKDFSIIDEFSKVVFKNPNLIAIIDDESSISYSNLDKKSNYISELLIEKGVAVGDRVAVYQKKNINTYATIIGILKAGAIYVPLDIKTPSDRINYILDDAKVKFMFTDQSISLPEKLNINVFKNIKISKSNRCTTRVTSEVICIYYTSGSTGKPKGVYVSENGLEGLIKSQYLVDLGVSDKVLQFSSLGFDVSSFEIWGTLLNGATLIASNSNQTIREIKETIVNYEVSLVVFVSSIFNLLAEYYVEVFNSLKWVLVGGEVVSPKYFNKVRNMKCELIQVYGPTENTTFSTFYKVKEKWDNTVPIGKPLNNTIAFIINEDGNLANVNEPGELVLMGQGVSKGYHNIESNNFTYVNFKGRNRNAYKTGDWVYINEDYLLVFIGRKDNQVKIRGNRVELEEVKKAMINISYIKDAHIETLEENNNDISLISFVSSNQPEINEESIRRELLNKLPDYMVPDVVIILKELPLNSSDKVDGKTLMEILFHKKDIPKDEITDIIGTILGRNIKPSDSLRNIGLNSLYTIRIIASIERAINIRVSYEEFSKCNLVSDLVAVINKLKSRNNKPKKIEINPNKDLLPIQKSMWVHQKLIDDNSSYNVIKVIEFNNRINENRLTEVINKLVSNSVLNSSFKEINNELCVSRKHGCHVMKHEIIDEKEYLDILKNEVSHNFFLEDNLARFKIITGLKRTKLIININHIICDGETVEILIQNISKNYEKDEDTKDIPTNNKQYMQYRPDSAYIDNIDSEPNGIYFPFENKNAILGESDKVELKIDSTFKKEIEEKAYKTSASLGTILQTGFHILLYIYSRNNDIQIGVPISLRGDLANNEDLGPYINNLVINQRNIKEKTINQLIKEVNKNMNLAIDNRLVPFEDIIKIKKPKRTLIKTSPLYDITFNYHNYFHANHPIINKVDRFLLTNSRQKLSMEVFNDKDTLNLEVKFNKATYERKYIEVLVNTYRLILEKIVSDDNCKINNISVQHQSPKIELDVCQDYISHNKYVNTLFTEQVMKTPHKVAVYSRMKAYTYLEIENEANNIANHLLNKGISPGQRIFVSLSKSNKLVSSMLAIWKVGCVFVPYKDESLMWDLSNNYNPTIIVENGCNIEDLDSQINIFDVSNLSVVSYDCPEVQRKENDEENCYISFTSGTSGKPKAILSTHRSVINYLFYIKEKFDISESTKTVQIPPITFDASIRDIFGTLMNGGTLVFPIEDNNPKSIIESIVKYKVNSILSIVPSFMELLLDCIKNEDNLKFNNIDLILLSGEKLTEKLVKKMEVIFNRARIVNQYGPSECTLTSTYFDVPKQYNNNFNSIPIGKPIPRQITLVLDNNLNEVPCGVLGNIYIGGEGLTKGYINNEQENKKAFLYNEKLGVKLYNTQDLGFIDVDGNLHFYMRESREIKYGGRLISLDAIQNEINNISYISESVVIMKNRKLICFVKGNQQKILKYLLNELHKIKLVKPQEFFYVDSIPLRENGKIDYAKFLKISGMPIKRPLEKKELSLHQNKLLKIYQKFGLENVNIDTNFFEAGGHSLLAIKIISEVTNSFRVHINIKEFYENPTINQLEILILRKEKMLEHSNTKQDFIKRIERGW